MMLHLTLPLPVQVFFLLCCTCFTFAAAAWGSPAAAQVAKRAAAPSSKVSQSLTSGCLQPSNGLQRHCEVCPQAQAGIRSLYQDVISSPAVVLSQTQREELQALQVRESWCKLPAATDA